METLVNMRLSRTCGIIVNLGKMTERDLKLRMVVSGLEYGGIHTAQRTNWEESRINTGKPVRN